MLNHSKILWYTRPGEAWTDALPLGNGRLGAMVYGGIEQEKIALNDDTLWSKTAVEIKDSKEAIQHARELILQRKFTEAEEFLTENLSDGDSASYQPAGDLLLEFPGLERHCLGRNQWCGRFDTTRFGCLCQASDFESRRCRLVFLWQPQ